MNWMRLRLLARGSRGGALVCAQRPYSMKRVVRGGWGGPVAPMWGLTRQQSGQQFSSVPDLNLNDFHGLADQILENILDKLIVVEESMDDVDISYAQGVLTVDLGSKGIWVVNKQTPNRQLWWSSPISGPLRFEYRLHDPSDKSDGDGGWYVTRENKDGSRTELLTLLSSEMQKVTGKDLVSSR